MNSEQLEGAKKLFLILLGIDIAATAIVGLNAFSTVGTLRDVQSGVRNIDQSMISSLEFWDGFSKLLFLTLIGVGLGLVKWLNACYSFAKQTIGATGFKNEGWTATGWIIPIFNLFKPYQIINEIYKAGSNGYAASDDWKKESGSGALLTWWLFWAVTHFIGWIMTKQLMRSALRDDITIPQAIGLTELQAWSCVISLVIAGLWFWVANLLTQRLLDRSAISANQESLKYAYQAPVAVPVATRPASTSAQPQSISAPIQTAMSATQATTQSINTQSAPIFDEDAVYEVVANEMESGKTDKGLWTRLFAELDGDEKKTKIAYIKQRAEKLMAAERNRVAELERQQAEEAAQLEIIRRERLSIREKLSSDNLTPEVGEEIRKLSLTHGTAFLNKVRLNKIEEVADLLEENPLFVAVTNSEGMTALHIAVEERYLSMSKLLIQKGALVNQQNMGGRSPLDIAQRSGNHDLLALLSAMQ